MPPLVPAPPRGFLGASLALALTASIALAQAPPYPADKGFIRSRSFDMPFNFPAADASRISALKLFVRPEQGGDWQLHATGTPAQTRYDTRSQLHVGNFDVRLDRDGTYQFALMTVFTNGTSAPPGIDQLSAGETVVVDTKPPAITLKALPTRSSGSNIVAGVEWAVTDENLARASVRLEGRWFGAAAWTPLGSEPEGRHEWTLPARQRMEVRLAAYDRSGNLAQRTIILGQGSASVTSGSAAPADEGPAVNQPNFRLVNNKTVSLQFRVREMPPSGLQKIELYYTRVGTDWTKHTQEFQAPETDKDAAEINFAAPEDGTYGFTMVAWSKAGIASRNPPKGNDPPQLWVEVDTKQPEGKIKNVKLAQPNDARTLVLEWEAKDKNIEAVPIIFEYAEVDAKGNSNPKWLELTTPLPNSGKYVCATPQLSPGSYQFRVRMNVFDKAGNVSTFEFDKPISVDVIKPQVEIFDVKTPKANQSPRQDQPPMMGGP